MSIHRRRDHLDLVTKEDLEKELIRRQEKYHKDQLEELHKFSDAQLKEWLKDV